MTFADLLIRLSGYQLPVPTTQEAATGLAAARTGAPDALAGPCQTLLITLINWCRIETLDTAVSRSAVIDALGPLRRQYMADPAAPAEDFRLLNRFIEAVDAAFDDEVLDVQHAHSD